jgi:hypothetical protein
MSNNSKETITKKQQDDLNSSFNSKVFLFILNNKIIFLDLPWGLPLGFPSLSPFGAFPGFGLPAPNFPPLNSFASSSTTAFPPPPSLLSNDSTNPWSNGSSATTNPIDYNEYAKQLGFLMNAFTEQETDKSKTKNTIQPSPTTKHSKTKQSHTSASPDVTNGKKHDDSRRSSSSSRSKSSTNPSSTTKTSTNPDPNMLDPLTFAAAAAAAAASGGLTFPYFLPSLLSQTSSTTGTNPNPSTYPFSSLSSSLTNPTAGLYPYLSPDWFTTPSALGNITPGKKKKQPNLSN